jgi:hypothetical protein
MLFQKAPQINKKNSTFSLDNRDLKYFVSYAKMF